MKLALRVLVLALISISATTAFCIDTPRVLPHKIRMGFISIGQYYGLNQYYSDDGKLKNLADKNSFVLDQAALSQVDARFVDLKNVLNQFGHSSLGSQLHLGEIKVDAKPDVRYYAPTMAYGLTKSVMVGAAFPFISYENNIHVTQTGSNLDYIRNQIAPHVSEIRDALDELDAALARGLNGTLSDKGYKPLSSQDKTYLGDVMLFTAVAFKTNPQTDIKTAGRLYLSLPTGPKPDPDDLTDLETFGRYSLRAQLIGEKPIAKQLSFLAEGSYLFVPEQEQVKRVPLNAGDTLPDKNQKYTLQEDLGDTVGGSVGLSFAYSEALTFATAYGYQYKFKDSFSGAPNGRGKYLEDGTSRSAQTARAQVGYSSVQDYLKKKAIIPGSIDYEIAKTMAGKNVENQTIHTLTFSMFF